MKSTLLIVLLFSLTQHVWTVLRCLSSQCNALSGFAACIEGICQCQGGWLFDCADLGLSLPRGRRMIQLTSNDPDYFILEGGTGQTNAYKVQLHDNYARQDIASLYSLSVLVDNGVGQTPLMPSGTLKVSSSTIQAQFQVTLNNKEQTSQPQGLVLKLTYLGVGNASVQVTYDYAPSSNSNILLILGYVAGGVLLVATIALMVIVYRKQDREALETLPPNKEAKQTPDISHFQAMMPPTDITPQQRREGIACSVCLAQFDFGNEVRNTPCGHVFHKGCIDMWCLKNLSCPLCRADLSSHNIIQMRLDQARKEQVSWITNSLAQEGQDYEQSEERESRRSMREALCDRIQIYPQAGHGSQ